MHDDLPKHEPDDQTIIRQLKDRNEDGLRALLQVHMPRVKAALEKRYGRRIDAEEIDTVVQQLLWKLWNRPDLYEEKKGTLGPWLLRIADNATKDLIKGVGRKRLRRAMLDDAGPFEAIEALDEKTSGPSPRQAEWLKALDEVRRGLPPRQQEVIDADIVAGGKAESERLAERLGTSKGAVEVARSKAWSRIREEFKRRGLALPEGAIK